MTQFSKRGGRLSKTFEGILTGLAYLAGILIFLMVLFITYEVVMRYFFRSPTNWVFDCTGFMLYVVTFLGTAWVLRVEGHPKVDIVLKVFSTKNQALMNCISSFTALIVCCVFLVQSMGEALEAYQKGEVLFRTFIIPRHILLWFIPLAFLLLCVEFARKGRKYLSAFRRM